ncbi:unnamed protein product [Caenorhabditis auriculariae]|uniref:Sodium/hydrogen exchanger n=1 Tax=Caenorhabditis auriculariae TaxID=2777116 RepID=A0A8S1HQN6_9PELO|nr:unnamed protein product [Caenorhabditis auriculariae]
MRRLLLIFLLICYATTNQIVDEHGQEVLKDFQLFTWKWEEVNQVYLITVWLLIASLAKILFKLLKPISQWLPESSLLIIVGLILGFLLHQTRFSGVTLDSKTFFLYLLPPIIFDAGYFMPNRALFENFDSVMLFAVLGTLWNTFSIGISLLLMCQYGLFSMSFTTFEIFVFAALISAVDPVAVIAVFEEIQVNEFLFINVFGEALFNDGVTVVLYQMFKSFALVGSEHLSISDYLTGGLSFFVVALGGAAIGLIFALITSLATKYTNEVKILAPVFIFILPYMGYLTAEMVSLSSIIAIAVCGMVMKQYVKGNISQAAANSVKYFIKMLAQSTETVIFMFLGLSTIASPHHFDFTFIIATVLFCLLYRAVGIVIQCYFLKTFRGRKFSKVDQFIMSYGGLRGAIAYGLVVSMPASINAKPMFVTTTIIVIYFTVFLQGITIRPLVTYLNVKRKEDRQATMAESVYVKYLDYMMSGVEDIAGQKGHYTFIENFERFNAKVIKPVLMRNEKKQSFDATTIVRAYEKITLEDAMNLANLRHSIENKRLEKIKSDARIANVSSNQIAPELTVTPKDIQLRRFMDSGENIDTLYSLFSDLLDRKLSEMTSKKVETSAVDGEDDIKDDYMKEIEGSRPNLQALHKSSDNLPSDVRFRQGRRQSTGDLETAKKAADFNVRCVRSAFCGWKILNRNVKTFQRQYRRGYCREEPNMSKDVSLSWLDYAIFAASIGLSLGTGIYHAIKSRIVLRRGDRTAKEEYLMGGRQLPPLPVALSLLTTFLSGILMLGVPAEMFQRGVQIWLNFVIGVASSIITCFVFLPVFHKMKSTCLHEYFIHRYNSLLIRRMFSALFLLFTITYMAVVVYAPSVALSPVLQIDKFWLILIFGCTTTLYTCIGGIKAVVWTDSLQAVLMYSGVLLLIIKGLSHPRVGGFGRVWEIASESGRLSEFVRLDWRIDQYNSLWINMFSGTIVWLASFGVNQLAIQRYASLPSLKQAQSIILFTLAPFTVLCSIVAFVGFIALAYFYNCNPIESGEIKEVDHITILFARDILQPTPGLFGLYVSCIMSATLSTLSSGMNSMAAAIYEDFLKNSLDGKITDTAATRLNKLIVLACGVISTALAFAAEPLGGILRVCISVMGAMSGPMVAIFVMALFMPRTGTAATLYSFIISNAITLVLCIANYVQDPYKELFLPTNTSSWGCDGNNDFSIRVQPVYDAHYGNPDALFISRISTYAYAGVGFVLMLATGYIFSFFEKPTHSVEKISHLTFAGRNEPWPENRHEFDHFLSETKA